MTTFSPLAQVDDDQMRRHAKIIYDVAGIRSSSANKQLLSNRIRRRSKETGIEDFEAYYAFLKGGPTSHADWNCFLQKVTTHETYLFRAEASWRWMRKNADGQGADP